MRVTVANPNKTVVVQAVCERSDFMLDGSLLDPRTDKPVAQPVRTGSTIKWTVPGGKATYSLSVVAKDLPKTKPQPKSVEFVITVLQGTTPCAGLGASTNPTTIKATPLPQFPGAFEQGVRLGLR